MKSMGKGAGIKLTTGETIGKWSLDDHDGQRERVSGGEDPGKAPLPRGDAGADMATGDAEADAFAGRMMENLMLKRLKLQAKQAKAAGGSSGSGSGGRSGAAATSTAPAHDERRKRHREREDDGERERGGHARERRPADDAPPRASAPAPAPSSATARAVAATAAVPEMIVKETNGEVSASVEETNRVRALLGLKPLAGTTAKPAAARTEHEPRRVAPGQAVAGPALPAGGAVPSSSAGAKLAAAPAQPSGKDAVLALRLERYCVENPAWR